MKTMWKYAVAWNNKNNDIIITCISEDNKDIKVLKIYYGYLVVENVLNSTINNPLELGFSLLFLCSLYVHTKYINSML